MKKLMNTMPSKDLFRSVTSVFIATSLATIGFGCAGVKPGRILVDASPAKPQWVNQNQLFWSSGSNFYIKSQMTLRGDHRLNACFEMAAQNNREQLVKSIGDDIKGLLDEAQTSSSENTESLFSKSRYSKWSGKVVGMRDSENYFERYLIQGGVYGESVERIDCFVVSQISKEDLQQTRLAAIQTFSADPKLKKLLIDRQLAFFKDNEPSRAIEPTAEIEATPLVTVQAIETPKSVPEKTVEVKTVEAEVIAEVTSTKPVESNDSSKAPDKKQAQALATVPILKANKENTDQE